MAECSEHFLNSLATIAAVNAQLLQPNLVIMRRPLDTFPRRFTTRKKSLKITRWSTCKAKYSTHCVCEQQGSRT